MISLADEGTHVAGADPKWSESFYFNFHDPSSGIAGLTRLGIRPHDGTVEGGWLLFLGGRRVAVQQLMGEIVGSGDLAVGPARFCCEEPMRRWRLQSSGEALLIDTGDAGGMSAVVLELDVAFAATLPPAPIGSELGRAFGGIGHYDQAGGYRGSVRVGDQAWRIDGYGLRDHTWGVRDWQAPEHWQFFSVVAGPGLAVCASQIVIGDKDLRGGWWSNSGATVALERVEADTSWAPDGIVPERVALRLTDARGKVLRLTGEILCPVAIPMEGGATRIVESLTRFHWGGREAYGISEHLCQVARG